jgi:hypothetical protein
MRNRHIVLPGCAFGLTDDFLMILPARTARLGGVVLVALLCCSCGGQQVKLYPVRGSVLFNGKPAAGATVVFHRVGASDAKSAEQAPLPTGTVQADGSFTLTTPPLGEGAPAGEYQVAVVWLDRDRVSAEGAAPNKLPIRYSTPQGSGLKVQVNEGPTELPPFQLTK